MPDELQQPADEEQGERPAPSEKEERPRDRDHGNADDVTELVQRVPMLRFVVIQ